MKMTIVQHGNPAPDDSGEPVAPLFRSEVTEHRATRLTGSVLLAQPLSTLWLTLAIFSAIGLAIGFLSFATYARTETVTGIVVTEQPAPIIVASETGIISQIKAREGALIRQGDELAVISSDRFSETGEGAAAAGLRALSTRAGLTLQQAAIAERRRQGERAQLQAALTSGLAQIDTIKAQIEIQRELVDSTKALFEQIGPVFDRGFVSRVEIERRRQTWLSAKQSHNALTQQQAALIGQIGQVQAQLSQLGADGLKDANDVASATSLLGQQRAELDAQRAYVLRAPVSGRVTAVQSVVGSTVLGGTTLMTIVPTNARLQIDLYAPSRAMAFLRPGIEARLLYDAFPYQRYGSFEGKVVTVSKAVIDPRNATVATKLEEPVFKVRVQPRHQFIRAYNQDLPLQPGMTLQANLVLERQTFLDWLLTPVRAVRNRY